jgi:peptidyl-prolyl cis-trans isomerase A (cyclophilin A)
VRQPLAYNGLTFHRVIPELMIQGGDPLGNGTGGTAAIPDEFHESSSTFRRVAMANSGPNTDRASSSSPKCRLPTSMAKHTIFGQVVEDRDRAVDCAVPTRNDKPLTDEN